MKKLPASLLWGMLAGVGLVAWQLGWLDVPGWITHSGHTLRAHISTDHANCHPVHIADGDTFTCLTNSHTTFKVRLRYIDAPERGQPYARAAQQTLRQAIWNQTVHLHTKEKDRYGRHVAEAYVHGRNINQHMVRSGHAWAYRQYLSPSQRQLYLQLEEEARSARRGLWADPHPVYPPDYRRVAASQSTKNN